MRGVTGRWAEQVKPHTVAKQARAVRKGGKGGISLLGIRCKCICCTCCTRCTLKSEARTAGGSRGRGSCQSAKGAAI